MTSTAAPAKPTSEQRDAVLKHHKHGRPAEMIATITRLPVEVITEIIRSSQAPRSSRQARAIEGLVELPVDHVHPSPNNPRERLTDIDELAASIRQVGLIQPIVVQPIVTDDEEYDAWQIVAGHRRYAAVRLLGWLNVPCLARRPLRSDEELLTMLIENGQRANLDPIEEARALSRLKAGGLVDIEIARQVGRSQSHVSGRLALLALPIEQQEEVRAGLAGVTVMTQKARLESGRVRPGAKGKVAASHLKHLGIHHTLGDRARSRCAANNHKGAKVGGTACGECWEAVIRADERTKIHEASAVAGRCLICDTVHDPDQQAS